MRKFLFLLLGVGYIFVSSCNSGTGGGGEIASSTGLVFPVNIQKGGDFQSVDQIRVQARTIIEHRMKEQPDPLAIITTGCWWPEFVFNAGKMSEVNAYEGYWIKFDEDFTYSYGQYSKTFGKGKYHYKFDDKSLYMLDDDITLEPKVWTANHSIDVMALVGTHQYGVNNGMQIKMISMVEKPTK